MKKAHSHRRPDAARLWEEIEERLAPKLFVSGNDRVLYFHLVRKTRLQGVSKAHFSVGALSRAIHVNRKTLRDALRRLEAKNALRVGRRDNKGLWLEVRLPVEILKPETLPANQAESRLETASFFSKPQRRCAIYRRENYLCFYCRGQLDRTNRVLDHVVAKARGGNDSFRNVVACCIECNLLKGSRRAEALLELLMKQNVITRQLLKRRLSALAALRAGFLRPRFEDGM